MKKLSQKALDAAKAVATRVRPKRPWPYNHPHVNRHYRERKGGIRYFYVDRLGSGRVTAQDVGRWMPHNGAREMARRVRQMEAANG